MTWSITVCSTKGGVGKTVGCYYLATAAARSGLRVLALDADPQHSLCEWHGEVAEPEFDVSPLIGRRYREAVERAAPGHDVVIVDTPPSESDTAVVAGALAASDIAVVPIGPERVEVSRLVKTLDLAQSIGVLAAVLVCRTDARWVDHKDLLGGLRSDPDIAMLGTFIPRLRSISQSFGRRVGHELHGYDAAWSELATALHDVEKDRDND